MSLLALQHAFRDRLVAGEDATAEGFAPSALAGLLVYQNNYRAQLVACLSETFERVRLWLGEEAFLEAAATHIDRVPPSSWTLDAYGTGFPLTLVELYPQDREVVDLARLELALADAFVGPDAPPLRPETLADVDWDNARLGLAPTLARLSIGSNAPAIWSALSAGEMPPAAETFADEATLIVWRQEQVSCFRTLDSDEALALAAIGEGVSFGALCHVLVERLGEEDGTARAGAFLGRWIADGLVTALESAAA